VQCNPLGTESAGRAPAGEFPPVEISPLMTTVGRLGKTVLPLRDILFPRRAKLLFGRFPFSLFLPGSPQPVLATGSWPSSSGSRR